MSDRAGRQVTNDAEFRDWIGKMFRPSPQYRDSIGQMTSIAGWCSLCAMTVIEPAVNDVRPATERYIERCGEWMHSAGRTAAHNWLGMAWAQERYEAGVDIILSDSPDIRGEIEGHQIVGDVGVCSFSAWLDGFPQLSVGDLWIGVINARTEVVLEAQIDIGSLMAEKAGMVIYPKERDELRSNISRIGGVAERPPELVGSLVDWIAKGNA